MPNVNRKQVAIHLIDKLSDDATYDDMMRELYEKIENPGHRKSWTDVLFDY